MKSKTDWTNTNIHAFQVAEELLTEKSAGKLES